MLAVLLTVSSLSAEHAFAAWELEPRADVGSRYDTNPRFSRIDEMEQDSNGLIADVTLTGSYKTERTSVSLAPRYRYGWYSSDDRKDLEDRDLYVNLVAQHQTLRNSFAANAGFSDVGIRRNELASTNVSNPSDDLNFLSDDRERWTFFPSWNFQFSEKLLLGLSGGYEQVEFDRASLTASNQFDYDYTSAEATIQRVLNEKNSLGLSATASRYNGESDDTFTEVQSDSSGLNLIYSFAFSENVDGSVRAGYSSTDVETDTFCTVPIPFFPFFTVEPCTLESDSSNIVGEISLTKRGERTTYDLSVRRALAPNSRGGEIINDRINVNLRHNFTQRFNLVLGVTAYQQSDAVDAVRPGVAAFRLDQDYAQIYTDLGWRMTRNVSIRTSYRFTYLKDENNLGQKSDARNHQVYLRLVYRPNPWRS